MMMMRVNSVLSYNTRMTLQESQIHKFQNFLPSPCNKEYTQLKQRKNELKAVPIFTVNDIEVHIHTSDKHVAVNPDFINCRRWQSMSNDNKSHDLAGYCPSVGQ